MAEAKTVAPASLLEALRDFRSCWLFVEEAESDGHCQRLRALCAKLRSVDLLYAAKFWQLTGTRWGALAVSKKVVPLKLLRKLSPDFLPSGCRTSRNIFTASPEKAFVPYQALIKIALKGGLHLRRINFDDNWDLPYLYCRLIPYVNGEFETAIFFFTERGKPYSFMTAKERREAESADPETAEIGR